MRDLQWVLVSLAAVCMSLYCLAAYLTFTRRTRNAIRQRTYQLVLLSSTGNAVNAVVTTLTGVWLLHLDAKEVWIGFYCGLITEYVFFGPYFMRGLLMKISFVDFLSTENYARLARRLEPSWYCHWLLYGFLMLCCIPLLLVISITLLSPHTPFAFTYSGPYLHLCIRSVFTLVHSAEVFALLLLLYYLRHVQEPHNLTREMQLVCLIIFLSSVIDAPVWPYHEISYMLLLIRDMGLLVVCTLWPVLVLWNEDVSVLPTPENIRCLEFAFQHAETLETFQQFLRGKRSVLEASDSTSTTHSQEGEGYLWFLIHLNELETKPTLIRAKRFIEMFSYEANFPSALVDQARDQLNTCSSSDVGGIMAAFEPLRCYATAVLANQFYPRFTASDMFVQLEKRVQMMTKLWGQMSR
jgi:hypothetical protein